jgi:hypothetical protein
LCRNPNSLKELSAVGSAGAETAAEVGGDFAMAGEAEGTEVVEVALSAAFGDGADVVGVPEGVAGGDGLHAPELEGLSAGDTSAALEGGVGGDGVGVAEDADAAVAGEDLVAEIAGVGAETPLVDAEVGAEGAAALGENLHEAPAAERAAVGAELGLGFEARDSACAGEGARS